MQFQVGQQIDHFSLVRCLGEGGQGEVWQATDLLRPGRQVALKRVAPPIGRQVDLERARREAHSLASVQHPGLVRCYKLLEPPERHELILVMELAEGTSLDDLLEDPRLTVIRRYGLLFQIAQALAALHQAGIVHRDLKPANIIVGSRFWVDHTEPGSVKLVDLGIAVEIGNPAPLTQPDRVIGTCPYMAPETLSPSTFDPARRGPTPAVDVFAWGVLAWQLLLGGHPTGLPYNGTLADFLMAYFKAQGNPSWAVSSLAPTISPLLRDCLLLEASKRIQDATGIVRRLLPVRNVPMEDLFTHTEEAPTPSVPPSFVSTSASFPAVSHTYNHAIPPVPPFSPSVIPPAPAPQRKPSRRPWLGTSLLFAAGFLGTLLLVGWFSLETPARTVSTSSPAPAPAPPRGTTAPGGPCACDTSKTMRDCASRRVTTKPYPCETNLPPSSSWKLRLSFVVGPGNRSLLDEDPNAQVKYCVSGTSQCKTITIREAGREVNRCGYDHALPVTVKDITARGIDVHVFSSAGVPRWSALGNKHASLRTGALCDGLIFAPRQGNGIQKVGFFLEDP